MKKTLLLLACLAGFSMMAPVQAQNTLTKAERTKAIAHLKKTQKELKSTIKGLSEAQLNYKPTEEAWSVAECMEHLAISEGNIMGLVQNTLKEEADPSKKSERKFQEDKALVKMISDRSFKVKTQKPFEPTGKFGSYGGSVKEFKVKRKSNMKFVKKTQEDLRSHFFEFPFGLADSYQIVLFMSGHTTRHTDQIKEVMADAGFPKS